MQRGSLVVGLCLILVQKVRGLLIVVMVVAQRPLYLLYLLNLLELLCVVLYFCLSLQMDKAMKDEEL
jgi:hypothetical protein